MADKNVRFIPTPVAHSGGPAGRVTPSSVLAGQVESETCSACGGSGWKVISEGANSRAVRCDCYLRGRTGKLLELAALPERYRACDFQSFSSGASNALAQARITVEKWVEEYPLDRTGLLLIGPSGVGKTHLSVAALKKLVSRGFHCLFCDYRELLKQIQNSYNATVQATELEVLQPVFESEIVVLDDLGAVKPSEWVWDTVSLVLNTRYNARRATIITTNFEDGPARSLGVSGSAAAARAETLGDRIGERMRSRLFEMCRLVQVDGKDYRERFRKAGAR